MEPFVDIIVLNYNGWRDTIQCLESVLRLDYPAFRVILCDNHSTDDSVDRLRAWLTGEEANAAPLPEATALRALVQPPVPKPVSFVEGDETLAAVPADTRIVFLRLPQNGGFGAGNNAGVALSHRDGRAAFVWLLNHDTVVAPDSLTALVSVAAGDATLGALGGTLLEFNDPERVQLASGGTVNLSIGMMTRLHQGGVPRSAVDASSVDFNFICGGCLFVRHAALDTSGAFDERFFLYGEDADLSLRIASQGWRLGYAADAFIWHKGGASTVPGSPFHDYHNLRSSLLLVHKWRRSRMPFAFLYWLYRGVAPKVLRRQWRRLPAVWRGYRDAIRVMRST